MDNFSIKRRISRVVIASVGVLAIVGSFMIPDSQVTVAHADPVGADECFPAVLMLRGSGEPVLGETNYPLGSTDDEALVRTNGAEGATISRAIDSFVTNTDAQDTISKLRFRGIHI